MSTIKSSTTTTTAYSVTADTTGALVFQTGATPTTAMTLGADQSVTFAGTPTYTGGTANGVAYLNGSKVLTTGSALVFDGTNLSTSGILKVTGNSFSVNDANGLFGKYSGNAYLQMPLGGNLQIWKSTTDAVATFDQSGNLGLGVTPGAWESGARALQMSVAGAGGTSGNTGSLWARGDSLRTIVGGYFNGSNYVATASNGASIFTVANGSFQWQSIASTTSGSSFSPAAVMTLDASGNLGVGTSSPSSYSKFAVINTDYSFGTFGTTNGTAVTVNIGSNSVTQGGYVNTVTNHPLIFGTNSTERARIDSSGNFLVGATGTISNFKMVISGTNDHLLLNGTSTYAQLNYFMGGVYKAQTYYTSATDRFINMCGTTGGVYLANGGTSWTALSDERAKDIIEPIVDGVKKLSELRTVVGKYKTDADGTRRSFLIAQDVLASFPEAVDATNADELGVRYQDLIPVLVKAIQEQQAIIQAQAADIAALKEKVGI